MKTKIVGLVLTFALLLQGCATQISQEQIASADYGPPPPENYEQLIKEYINKRLIDPTSPVYEFDAPRKGYTKKSPMYDTEEAFGWRVCGTVNSKNRLGGYVGRVPFFVLFRNEVISSVFIGRITHDKYDMNLDSEFIRQACLR